MSNALKVPHIKRGIEELLKGDARVMFENLFSTRHIGRVLDFVVFQSRGFVKTCAEPGDAEFRIRTITQLAAFNAWTNYRQAEGARCVELEFGWDEARLIIAVSSYIDASVAGFMPGQQTQPGTAAFRIQKMLEQMQALSDGLIVRHNAARGRFQIVAFIDKKRELQIDGAAYQTIDADQIGSVRQVVTPEPLSAGGMDSFRKEEELSAQLAHGSGAASTPLVEVEKVEENSLNYERQRAPEQPEQVLSKGTRSGPPRYDDAAAVPGASPEVVTPTVEPGLSPAVATALERLKESNGDPAQTEATLRTLLESLRADVSAMCPGLTPVEFDTGFETIKDKVEEGFTETLQHLMRVKDIQTIAKIKQFKDQNELLVAERDQFAEETQRLRRIVMAAQKAGVVVDGENIVLPTAEEVAKSDDAAMKKIMDAPAVPEEAKDWAQAFMDDLLQQRAIFSDRCRSLEQQLQKVEEEKRAKENALSERARLLDAELSSKDSALKQKEQAMASAMSTLNATRNALSITESDVTQLKVRIASSQRLLEQSKETNTRLEGKVSELHRKWNEEYGMRTVLQEQIAKQRHQLEEGMRQSETFQAQMQKDHSTELTAVATQRDRAVKQLAELSAQNRELQGKLSQLTSARLSAASAADRASNSETELRHKLEQSNKITKAMKDELERTRRKFDELKLSETQLRVEIGRLQAQMKTAGRRNG